MIITSYEERTEVVGELAYLTRGIAIY